MAGCVEELTTVIQETETYETVEAVGPVRPFGIASQGVTWPGVPPDGEIKIGVVDRVVQPIHRRSGSLAPTFDRLVLFAHEQRCGQSVANAFETEYDYLGYSIKAVVPHAPEFRAVASDRFRMRERATHFFLGPIMM